MIKALILKLIGKDVFGILVKMLLLDAGKAVARDVLDKENQQKAYEFVKALKERDDLTKRQKAKEFNKMMLKWSKEVGKDICSSVINCLRELAVTALKTK